MEKLKKQFKQMQIIKKIIKLSIYKLILIILNL
jgi:hypothetical protein